MSLRFISSLIVIATTTSCLAEDKSTASFSYDLAGGHPLYAYPLEPAAKTRDYERATNHIWGSALGVRRSPKFSYFCVWRPSSQTGFVPPDHTANAPEQIIMSCTFGTSPWTPPSNMIEAAREATKHQEATFVMWWERRGNKYVPLVFNAEIRNPLKPYFRSANTGQSDISQIHFVTHRAKFPNNSRQSLSFDLSASVPYRLNGGESAKKPTVSLRIQGTAAPMPDWLDY